MQSAPKHLAMFMERVPSLNKNRIVKQAYILRFVPHAEQKCQQLPTIATAEANLTANSFLNKQMNFLAIPLLK